MATLTAIITTYKRPALLKRAIASVLAQTFPDFQLCIYDNASGDETSAVVNSFKDPRIKYHCHPNNIGMMANYAYAFERIDTPYFCFLSDDDFIYPWFYETAMDDLKKYPQAAFCACGVIAVDENKNLIADPTSLWPKEGLYRASEGLLEMIAAKGRLPIPVGILFRKSEISPDWSPELQLMWDPEYLMRIAAKYPVVINKKTCGVFWAHSQAFSSSFYTKLLTSSEGFEQYLSITGKILSKLSQHPGMPSQFSATYTKMINDYVAAYMKKYIRERHFTSAGNAYKSLVQHFNPNKHTLLLNLWAQAADKLPVVDILLKLLVMPLVFAKRLLKKTHAKANTCDHEGLKHLNEYSL